MDSRTFESFKEAATYAAAFAKTRKAVVSLRQLGAHWQVVILDTSIIDVERNPVGGATKPEEPEVGPPQIDNHFRFSVQRRSRLRELERTP